MPEMDSLHRRGKALEDEFFHRVDEQLGARLREKLELEESRLDLEAETGFHDQELLDHLIDAGITSSSIAALALVPAVFVAWADGRVTPAERQAILSAALRHGVKDSPTAFDLLETWLHHCPPPSLWNVWEEYAAAVDETLTPKMSAMLHAEFLRMATNVAKASNSRFGKGKLSVNEQAILDKLAAMQ